jgi:hypothetical protein
MKRAGASIAAFVPIDAVPFRNIPDNASPL